jgi:hypothetical protein
MQKQASFSLFCEFMCGLGSIHASSVCVGSNEKISNFSGERNFGAAADAVTLPNEISSAAKFGTPSGSDGGIPPPNFGGVID